MNRILCVDDERDDLEQMAKELCLRGYVVEKARTPKEALSLFSANPFAYDIILTDLDFGRTDQHNGVWLAQQILQLREQRGYDAAPEVISITGKMIDPDVLNKLQALGARYVLKGRIESFLVEVDGALARLERFRKQGPTVVLVHTCSMNPNEDTESTTFRFGCPIGEAVNSAHLLHSGLRVRIPIAPAPLLLLDYLGRRAVRRPLRLEEIANGMNNEEFYYFWLGRERDHTVSSDSVKTNINRIRKAFAEAFKSASLKIDPDTLLATERIGEESTEDEFDSTVYRLKANIVIEHSQ